ncbi:SDR family NAD(P)-dependent oxidoreductase [Pigmentibacter sp. JX0631]|uniref:SDR family NAD(P)-dependent oxidoreductase n=1 Tax=Pigmentibacter sp. JX0631 TaxID=2976982 RepID=UPI00246890B0|nr:SDR family oxidoreductase [Pigmentibacter sp. JX0631]WGL59839.1 SDR family NAD(P)-dependent oxidoreductase [Pigmentibacter sp. JX0631]
MQNELFSVKNKKILITGASSGLGAHYAEVLAKAGAHLFLIARREEQLKNLVKSLNKENANVMYLSLDLTNLNLLQKSISELLNKINGVDVLINNAGYSPKIKKSVFELENSDWNDIFDINLKSMWYLTTIVANNMQLNKINGSIINISSTVANRTRIGNPLYGISKSAVISLTKKYAVEFAKYNIRVNSIAPGFFETDMNRHFIQTQQGKDFLEKTIPLGRKGNYDELNGALFLFASNASTYITGESIFVDGGYIANSISN